VHVEVFKDVVTASGVDDGCCWGFRLGVRVAKESLEARCWMLKDRRLGSWAGGGQPAAERRLSEALRAWEWVVRTVALRCKMEEWTEASQGSWVVTKLLCSELCSFIGYDIFGLLPVVPWSPSWDPRFLSERDRREEEELDVLLVSLLCGLAGVRFRFALRKIRRKTPCACCFRFAVSSCLIGDIPVAAASGGTTGLEGQGRRSCGGGG